ncbi:10172_t:CDS:2, partial [Cetraspora pellucida]
ADLLGYQRLYIEVESDLEDSSNGYITTKNKNGINDDDYDHSFVEKIISDKLKKPIDKLYLGGKIHKCRKENYVPGTSIIAEKLLEHSKVYVNILEMGLFQYFTYSHRADKESKKENDNASKTKNDNDSKPEDDYKVDISETINHMM